MSAARLFDYLINRFDLKNDRGLAHALEESPSNISRARAGKIAFGDTRILDVHEVFEVPIKEIKELLKNET